MIAWAAVRTSPTSTRTSRLITTSHSAQVLAGPAAYRVTSPRRAASAQLQVARWEQGPAAGVLQRGRAVMGTPQARPVLSKGGWRLWAVLPQGTGLVVCPPITQAVTSAYGVSRLECSPVPTTDMMDERW